MARFTAETTATAVVPAGREEIWAILTDPDRLASLIPFLRRITPDGEHWRWEMSGIDVLGLKVAPTFTEKMTFVDLERIDFRHDPPADASERAAVEGWYVLEEADDGTRLSTGMEITLDLPLPALSRKAVVATMKGVIGSMGDRFAANLLAELGV
ncbi:MAG: hypothetical protein F2667_14125 [Actinobacteria bacterium]|uniref:Unannotated protein n=1 Tax=freshwater metagenome TaxID=449393 RepID=A0A6J6SDJ4_9ZZZZ|nr:hypothetical protein [Actinomycetota bacterium]